MGFKEWFKSKPTWLKTGIIFIGIYLLISLFDFSTTCRFGTNFYDPCGMILAFSIWPVFLFILNGGYAGLFFNYFSYPFKLFDGILPGASGYLPILLLGLIFYFIIGSLVGLIIQGIVYLINRNKQKQ